MKLLGIVAVIIMVPCAAQQDLGKRFRDCAYQNGLQLIVEAGVNNSDIATESAFHACETEEQALYTSLYAAGMDQTAVSAIMVRLRLQIKANLRKITSKHPK